MAKPRFTPEFKAEAIKQVTIKGRFNINWRTHEWH